MPVARRAVPPQSATTRLPATAPAPPTAVTTPTAVVPLKESTLGTVSVTASVPR